MADWKDKLMEAIPDLKDKRIKELELENARLHAENRRLSAASQHLEKDIDRYDFARVKAANKRTNLEIALDEAQKEIERLKHKIHKAKEWLKD